MSSIKHFSLYVNYRYIISFYTPCMNSLMRATLQLNHVAAVYNCYVAVVH